MKVLSAWSPIGSLVAAILLLLAPGATAQVKVGDLITDQNAYKVKDLVSPGTYYMVQNGMRMTIQAPVRTDWPPPFKDATEKYSAQVKLGADHHELLNYVAGLPFPMVDPNDPDVAIKLMWNWAHQPNGTDDYDLRDFECRSTYVEKGRPEGRIILDQEVGHYAGYMEVGRTEVEPTPIDKDFLQSGRLWLFGVYPVLSPENDRGTGLIRYRYANPHKLDAIWTWSPGANRLRRLNDSMMSTATDATPADPDLYNGFDGKIEDFDYRFIGDRTMLEAMNVPMNMVPTTPCPYDGGVGVCPAPWQLRHVYVIEAHPRMGWGLRDYLETKQIVYMDAENYWYPYVDTYDRKGQLWRTTISWFVYADRPVTDARVAIYPFKRVFQVNDTLADVQGGFASTCYLPSPRTAERECWYINMGAVDRPFFDPDSMVKTALR